MRLDLFCSNRILKRRAYYGYDNENLTDPPYTIQGGIKLITFISIEERVRDKHEQIRHLRTQRI